MASVLSGHRSPQSVHTWCALTTLLSSQQYSLSHGLTVLSFIFDQLPKKWAWHIRGLPITQESDQAHFDVFPVI